MTNRSVYTERRRVSFFRINFYSRRVALKCCVGFYSTSTIESAIYMCVCVCVCVYPLPIGLPSHSGHHRALSRVPCALQHVEKWFYVGLPCCLAALIYQHFTLLPHSSLSRNTQKMPGAHGYMCILRAERQEVIQVGRWSQVLEERWVRAVDRHAGWFPCSQP